MMMLGDYNCISIIILNIYFIDLKWFLIC